MTDVLCQAIRDGDVATINAELAKDIDIDAHDSKGHRPITIAAKEGNLDLIQRLVAKGAKLVHEKDIGHLLDDMCDCKDLNKRKQMLEWLWDDERYLQLSSCNVHLEHLLAASGVPMISRKPDTLGFTPLHYTIGSGLELNPNILENFQIALLKESATIKSIINTKIKSGPYQGLTLGLMMASYAPVLLEALVESDPTLIVDTTVFASNPDYPVKRTTLKNFLIENNFQKLSQELEKRMSISSEKVTHINNMCEFSREGNLVGLTVSLLSHPEDINELDSSGLRPLDYAAMKGKQKIFHYLISKGASLVSQDQQHTNLLYQLTKEGMTDDKREILSWLLIAKNCKEMEAAGVQKDHIFAARGDLDESLKKGEADADNIGLLPIHYAIFSRYKDVINYLLTEEELNQEIKVGPYRGVSTAWLLAVYLPEVLDMFIKLNPSVCLNLGVMPRDPRHISHGCRLDWILANNGRFCLLHHLKQRGGKIDLAAKPTRESSKHTLASILGEELCSTAENPERLNDIDLLIELGADPNYVNVETTSRVIGYAKDVKVIERLHDGGARLTIGSNKPYRTNFLIGVCYQNRNPTRQAEILNWLLKDKRYNELKEDGVTVNHILAALGEWKSLENSPEDCSGFTPLHYAIVGYRRANDTARKTLIDVLAKADLNQPIVGGYFQGVTLAWLICYEAPDIFEELLKINPQLFVELNARPLFNKNLSCGISIALGFALSEKTHILRKFLKSSTTKPIDLKAKAENTQNKQCGQMLFEKLKEKDSKLLIEINKLQATYLQTLIDKLAEIAKRLDIVGNASPTREITKLEHQLQSMSKLLAMNVPLNDIEMQQKRIKEEIEICKLRQKKVAEESNQLMLEKKDILDEYELVKSYGGEEKTNKKTARKIITLGQAAKAAKVSGLTENASNPVVSEDSNKKEADLTPEERLRENLDKLFSNKSITHEITNEKGVFSICFSGRVNETQKLITVLKPSVTKYHKSSIAQKQEDKKGMRIYSLTVKEKNLGEVVQLLQREGSNIIKAMTATNNSDGKTATVEMTKESSTEARILLNEKEKKDWQNNIKRGFPFYDPFCDAETIAKGIIWNENYRSFTITLPKTWQVPLASGQEFQPLNLTDDFITEEAISRFKKHFEETKEAEIKVDGHVITLIPRMNTVQIIPTKYVDYLYSRLNKTVAANKPIVTNGQKKTIPTKTDHSLPQDTSEKEKLPSKEEIKKLFCDVGGLEDQAFSDFTIVKKKKKISVSYPYLSRMSTSLSHQSPKDSIKVFENMTHAINQEFPEMVTFVVKEKMGKVQKEIIVSMRFNFEEYDIHHVYKKLDRIKGRFLTAFHNLGENADLIYAGEVIERKPEKEEVDAPVKQRSQRTTANIACVQIKQAISDMTKNQDNNLYYHLGKLAQIPKPQKIVNANDQVYFHYYLLHSLRAMQLLALNIHSEDNLCHKLRNLIRHFYGKLSWAQFYELINPMFIELKKLEPIFRSGKLYVDGTKLDVVMKKIEELLNPFEDDLKQKVNEKTPKDKPRYERLLKEVEDCQLGQSEQASTVLRDASLMLKSLIYVSDKKNAPKEYGDISRALGHDGFEAPYEEFAIRLGK